MKKQMRRVWRQLTADKKKFGLMVTVSAVGLLLWGRLILLEEVPRIATADPSADQPAAASAAPAFEFAAPREVRTPLSDTLTHNLFAFRHNRYKPLPDEDSGNVGVQSGNPGDDEQQRRQELVQAARELRLQSVIQGARPAIVVNGRVLRVGDSIEQFEIVSFDDRTAKVTRDGLTFTLTMLPD